MGAKHRMPQRPTLTAPATNHHLHAAGPLPGGRRSRTNLVIGAVSASVATAGVLAGAAVFLLDYDPGSECTPPAAPAAVAAPQSVNQQGTIIAVTDTSVTARSADGYTQTYVITPQTTAVTADRSESVPAATQFAVNDQVSIVGTVQGGTAVATAVADQAAVGLSGPPMDSVGVQPVSLNG
jgi:hypothetical protein